MVDTEIPLYNNTCRTFRGSELSRKQMTQWLPVGQFNSNPCRNRQAIRSVLYLVWA